MPIRWKLFGLANYVLLLVYFYLFLKAIEFTVEEVPDQKNLTPFIPFLTSLLVIILNSIFNLYIFHRHLPNKLFSRGTGIFYLISTILSAIALTIISISLFSDISDELKYNSTDNFIYFLILIFFLTLLPGLFVLVNQFLIRKFIEKNYRSSLNS